MQDQGKLGRCNASIGGLSGYLLNRPRSLGRISPIIPKSEPLPLFYTISNFLKVQMYKQAAYCYEELLLLAPSQLTYSIRYADVMYTIGTVESVSTAQAYYSNAIESSHGTCIRALYGLVLCTTHPKLKKVSFLFITHNKSVFSGGW